MSNDNFWLDDYEAESGGGGGLVGETEVSVGWKTFVSGSTQEESFFQFKPGDDKSKEAAKVSATAFLEKHGLADKNPQMSVQFRMFKASCIELGNNRAENWQDDRFFVHPFWTPAYKQVVKGEMQKVGVNGPGKYFVRISFKDDPSGRMRTNPNWAHDSGPEVPAEIPQTVEYISDVYPNKEAAKAAWITTSTESDGASAGIDAPEGWTVETWLAQKDDIAKLLGDSPAPAKYAEAAAAYDVSVPQVKALVA